jgi:hypothetical protein
MIPRLVQMLPSAAVAVSLSVTLLSAAQRGWGGPRYDLTTETTVTGTVETTEQISEPGSGRGRRGLGGTHLALKTATETLEVHLGPTAFLEAQNFSTAKGDRLEVVGSRVTVDGERVFIAKSVRKDGRTWTLRDPAGVPVWRGGRGPAGSGTSTGQ